MNLIEKVIDDPFDEEDFPKLHYQRLSSRFLIAASLNI